MNRSYGYAIAYPFKVNISSGIGLSDPSMVFAQSNNIKTYCAISESNVSDDEVVGLGLILKL